MQRFGFPTFVRSQSLMFVQADTLNPISLVAAGTPVEDLGALLKSPVAALVFIFAVGALGLYMLLPGEQRFSASAVKWFGGPLTLISLVLLGALVGVRAAWWPDLPAGEQVSRIAFAVLAAVSLAAALRAVIARRMSTGGLWFAGLVASS